MSRKPVPIDNIDRFQAVIHSLTGPFGIQDVPEIMHYVELLSQACDRYIFEASHKSPTSKAAFERKRFISVFKAHYLQLTDMEYSRVVTDLDCKLINNVIKTVEEKGLSSEEYLRWLFEVFLPNNEKLCPPTFRLVCSGFVMDKFLYEYREVIKERLKEAARKRDVMNLIERGKAVIRSECPESVKEKVRKLLLEYRHARIMLNEFRDGMAKVEVEARQAEQKNT